MKINILEIKDIVSCVCDKFIENNGNYLETEQDYFWYVDMEQALDFQKKPSSLCVGSLEDDYRALKEIVKDKRIINILDLDRVSDLFKIISYEVEKSGSKMM